MRYIKQIAIMMLMICWAAQGLAQTTRASEITPDIVKRVIENLEIETGCDDVTLNYDKKTRQLVNKKDKRHIGDLIKVEESVIAMLGSNRIEIKGKVSSRIVQQPKLGTLRTETVKSEYTISRIHNDEPPSKGNIPIETKAYRYYFNEALSPSIPIDKQGNIKTNDWHLEDKVKFEVTANNKKFVVSYNINISHDNDGSCWDADKEQEDALNIDGTLQVQFILESITEGHTKNFDAYTLDAYIPALAGKT